MKRCFFLIALLAAISPARAEESKDEWQNTVLTDATIKKIQEAKFAYKKCIGEQMQKPAYLEMDSRKATDDIMKLCEPTLGKIREVYLNEKMPMQIADRHLKQIRIQTARKALQNMLFSQAARSTGQP